MNNNLLGVGSSGSPTGTDNANRPKFFTPNSTEIRTFYCSIQSQAIEWFLALLALIRILQSDRLRHCPFDHVEDHSFVIIATITENVIDLET